MICYLSGSWIKKPCVIHPAAGQICCVSYRRRDKALAGSTLGRSYVLAKAT